MQIIQILNPNNQALNVQAIRYFSMDDKRYFAFSLNEIDEQGYVKVYVSKVLGLNGTIAAYDIIDETEWAKVKEVVKSIIKANREGNPVPVTDLDMNPLHNIKVNGQQAFKLMPNLVEWVGANIVVKEDNVVTSSVESVSVAPVEPVSNVVEPVEAVPVSVEPTVDVATSNGDSQFASDSVVPSEVEMSGTDSLENETLPVAEVESTVSSSEENVSYKALYLEELQKNEQLLAEMTKYKTQLENIKAILN